MIGRLEHIDPDQNAKERWLDAVGETPTHWLAVMSFLVGSMGSLVYGVKKDEYRIVDTLPPVEKVKKVKKEKPQEVLEVVGTEALSFEDLV